MIKTTIKDTKVNDDVLSPFGKSYRVVTAEPGEPAVAQAVGGTHQVRLDDRKLANGSWIVFGQAQL